MAEPRPSKRNLASLRQAAGLSQHEVAERLNALVAAARAAEGAVTSNMISRWERGVVTPQPHYRRMLAELFGIGVEDLDLNGGSSASTRSPGGPSAEDGDDRGDVDGRVAESQQHWRSTRQALNAHRAELSRLAALAYDPVYRFGATGLLTCPTWMPNAPLELSRVELAYEATPPDPALDGTEAQTAHVRPHATLTRSYDRYTRAIRDIDHPRLFENRPAWRLLDVGLWEGGDGRLTFGPTTYFAATDVTEAVAHETAYVHVQNDTVTGKPTMRDLPFRKLIGDPFDCARRPILPSIGTLTIRRSPGGDGFILHRRDPRRVAVAGGMLQVIPSGVFQPSSVHPRAERDDFDLWRNIMREYSEELLGNPEHDGDGRPVQYDAEPFASLNRYRAEGRISVYCLGLALDALTLFGEILTVAVIDADLFDSMAGDFVDYNDEGTVLNSRVPFTRAGVDQILNGGRLAPAGAVCIQLAWQHRDTILG
jgi:transcriptional regulator with XRE-family HTH domain